MKNFMKKLGTALLGAVFTVVAIVAIYLLSGLIVLLLNALRSGISALASFAGSNLFMFIVALVILCIGLTVFYMFCQVPFKGWIDSKLAEGKANKKKNRKNDEDEEPERIVDMVDHYDSHRTESRRRRYVGDMKA